MKKFNATARRSFIIKIQSAVNISHPVVGISLALATLSIHHYLQPLPELPWAALTVPLDRRENSVFTLLTSSFLVLREVRLVSQLRPIRNSPDS